MLQETTLWPTRLTKQKSKQTKEPPCLSCTLRYKIACLALTLPLQF